MKEDPRPRTRSTENDNHVQLSLAGKVVTDASKDREPQISLQEFF